jgi:hypothetical protein
MLITSISDVNTESAKKGEERAVISATHQRTSLAWTVARWLHPGNARRHVIEIYAAQLEVQVYRDRHRLSISSSIVGQPMGLERVTAFKDSPRAKFQVQPLSIFGVDSSQYIHIPNPY